KYLCAYFISDKDVKVQDLRDYLRSHLPDYMVPTYFVKIDQMPLTTGGKLDRRALPSHSLEKKSRIMTPRNEIEERIVNIWSEVLSIQSDKISIDENFFKLGGHSLKATLMVTKINKEFNLKLSLKEVFNHPYIKDLSVLVTIAINRLKVSERELEETII
ncbi:MAG: phosphopantetheine-binding protein, partial [Candidatus Thorarchaeota archaeon]